MSTRSSCFQLKSNGLMFVLLHPCLGMHSSFRCILLCFLEGFTCLEKLPHFHALNQRTEIQQGANLEMHFLLSFQKIKTQCICLVKVQAFEIPSHTHILPCAPCSPCHAPCTVHPTLSTSHPTWGQIPVPHNKASTAVFPGTASVSHRLFPFRCSSAATQRLHENLLHLRQLSHLRKKYSGSHCLPPLASKFRVS